MPSEHPLVLVVDDEPAALDTMCSFLGEAGYRLQRARDGREALELIRGLQPDAVVLDLMLPVISGGRVLAMLHREQNDVPVVLVSGVVKAPAFRETLDFLPKPCDPDALRSAVARAVGRRMRQGRLRDVMSRPPVTVAPTTPVADAEWIATGAHVHHLLVIERERLIGIVCSHDLRDADAVATVGECMSAPVVCIEPDAPLDEAAQTMRRDRIGCLPVVAGGRIVGVVTRCDIRRAGIPIEDPHGEVCAACGARHHVRPDLRDSGTMFCLECLERSQPPRAEEDIGVGD